MTPDKIRSIRQSIEECNRYIEKESSRDADLRPAEVAKRLEWYKSHRAKLYEMLGE